MHEGGDRVGVAVDPADPGANVLQHHRIPLLRHDRTDLHELGSDPEHARFLSRPDEKVVHEPAERRTQRRDNLTAFEEVIARSDRVVSVFDDPVEPKQLGGEFAIDGKAGRGEGRGAERRTVHPRACLRESFAVPFERTEHAEQIVGEGGWLGGLRVGDAGNHDIDELFGERDHAFP